MASTRLVHAETGEVPVDERCVGYLGLNFVVKVNCDSDLEF